jgi:hypothetical protein
VTDLIDATDNLMTGNQPRLVQGEVAFHDVDVGAADRAGADLHSHFARTSLRLVEIGLDQRRFLYWFLFG